MTKAEINKRIFELTEDAEVVDYPSNSAPKNSNRRYCNGILFKI